MQDYSVISGNPTEEEAAAILVAIGYLIAEQSASDSRTEIPAASWNNAAKLMAQGLIPTRMPASPRWGTIERLRRAGRGGNGISGL